MKTSRKFAVLVVVVLGAVLWLAAGGVNETKTYYKTVAELHRMGAEAYAKRVRVAGEIEPGSIVRKGRAVSFVLQQDQLRLKVIYDGADPLPDTFRDGAQALADGKMGRAGVFQASQIQAKCASKYEAKPGVRDPASSLKAG